MTGTALEDGGLFTSSTFSSDILTFPSVPESSVFRPSVLFVFYLCWGFCLCVWGMFLFMFSCILRPLLTDPLSGLIHLC